MIIGQQNTRHRFNCSGLIILVIACWVATRAVSGVCVAQADQEISIQVVEVEEGREQRPFENVYIYVPPIAMVRNEKIEEWLKKSAVPTESRERKFEVVNGVLKPEASIAFVGDKLQTKIDGKYPLTFLFFSNPPVGVSSDKYEITSAEAMVSVVEVLGLRGVQPASLLTIDHTLSQITDVDGKTAFANLPENMEVPFRVRIGSAQLAKLSEVSSKTLQISRKGHFVIDTRIPKQKHVIEVRKLAR